MEAIRGWRVWDMYPDDGLLRSIFQPDVWPPGTRMDAKCRRQGFIVLAGRECESAPRAACTCGVYAVRHRLDLDRFSRYEKKFYPDDRHTFEVIGTVSLWGRIVRHEYGLRAEKAYPYELWVCPPAHTPDEADELMEVCKEAAALLRKNYMVDVSVAR